MDASITNLIRPAMYNAYHHITHLKEKKAKPVSCVTDHENLEAGTTYDVVRYVYKWIYYNWHKIFEL